jgi:hypothetical protein
MPDLDTRLLDRTRNFFVFFKKAFFDFFQCLQLFWRQPVVFSVAAATAKEIIF